MASLKTFMHETVTAQFPAPPQACVQLSIFTTFNFEHLCAFVLLPKPNCNKVYAEANVDQKKSLKNDLNEVKVCRCII